MTNESEGTPVARHSGLKKTFSTLLAGVASVLPVLATFWLLLFLYQILGKAGDAIIDWILGALNFLLGRKPADADYLRFQFFGSEMVRALLPVAIVFAIGFAVTNTLGKHILHWVEDKIAKLPVLGFVYSSVKQLIEAVRGIGAERNFKGVAFVDYPSPGCRLLGFITGTFHDPKSGKNLTAVFLPTAPNPLTGFVVLMEEDRVIKSDMSLEAASKLILSAGLVAPPPGSAGGLQPVGDARLRELDPLPDEKG